MVIDLERCYGCRTCMAACKVENNTPRGAFWMFVHRYEEGEYPDVDQRFMPTPCNHCSEPACEKVCPTGARFKREEDGIVLTDYDQCIGCRYCETACPYGVNYFQWRSPEEGQYLDPSAGEDSEGNVMVDEVGTAMDPWSNPEHERDVDGKNVSGGQQPQGVMGKCTLCAHRFDRGEEQTACEQACPADAIKVGDMDDPDSEPNAHLREKSSSHQFRLLDEQGTEPNVKYIGPEPSKEARSVEGAETFKDPEKAIEESEQAAENNEFAAMESD